MWKTWNLSSLEKKGKNTESMDPREKASTKIQAGTKWSPLLFRTVTLRFYTGLTRPFGGVLPTLLSRFPQSQKFSRTSLVSLKI